MNNNSNYNYNDLESTEDYGTSNSNYLGNLPFGVDYKTPAAIGVAKRLMRAKFYPFGASATTWSSNDTFRFNLKTPYFLDPFSTSITVTIEFPATTLADDGDFHNQTTPTKMVNKIAQLDGCGYSIFQYMTLSEQGVELERIMQLDVIANVLKDVNYGRAARTTRDYEGLGGQLMSNFTNQTFRTIGYSLQYNTSGGGFSVPTGVENKGLGNGNSNSVPNLFFDPTRNYNYTHLSNITDARSQVNAEDPGILNAYAVRQEHDTPMVPSNLLYGCPSMGFETLYGDGYQGSNGLSVGSGYTQNISGNTGNVNGLTYPTDSIKKSDTNLYTADKLIPNYGYHNPFPANFGTTTFEPMLSLIPQRVIANGVPSVAVNNKLTLIVPLFSGILGALMQPNNYKLIPMVAFKDLILEFQFNPYAFFTSWSSTAYQDRKYLITGIELNCDVVEYMDLNIIRATNEALRTGFSLQTQSYYMGPIYTIQNNNIPKTLQINLGFDSLRAIYLVFLANDYLNNTMFRKHYRLSANLSSLQLKIGTEYYPGQALRGNGGSNFGPENNAEFFYAMLRSMGKQNNVDDMGVNIHNSAINWRESLVAYKEARTKIASTTDPALKYRSYDAFVCSGMQLGFFYENRCVGKCIYGLPLDTINYDNTLLSGIKTTDARPFELLLDYNQGQNYPYPENMAAYVFCYYDLVIIFNNGEVRSVGKS